ncbi:MAG: hypothetical protein AAGK92_13195 [Pseudomonadota bacterium]
MSDSLAIGENEVGLYRIFALDLSPGEVTAFTTPVVNAIGDDDYPLRDALGVNNLDEQHVQIVDIKELKTIGLETYLSEGLGVKKADYAAILPALEALNGPAAVIATAAFERPEIIVPTGPVSFIGLLKEDKPHQAFIDLSVTSAEGLIETKNTPADPPDMRTPLSVKLLIAFFILALLAGLFALFNPGDVP